jgi:hypothetical protein
MSRSCGCNRVQGATASLACTATAATLTVRLTSVLSLRASQAIEYRHTPVPGFGRSDIRTAVALVLSTAPRPQVR